MVELIDVVFGEREEDMLIPTIIRLEIWRIVDESSGRGKDDYRAANIGDDRFYGGVGAGGGSGGRCGGWLLGSEGRYRRRDGPFSSSYLLLLLWFCFCLVCLR